MFALLASQANLKVGTLKTKTCGNPSAPPLGTTKDTKRSARNCDQLEEPRHRKEVPHFGTCLSCTLGAPVCVPTLALVWKPKAKPLVLCFQGLPFDTYSSGYHENLMRFFLPIWGCLLGDSTSLATQGQKQCMASNALPPGAPRAFPNHCKGGF